MSRHWQRRKPYALMIVAAVLSMNLLIATHHHDRSKQAQTQEECPICLGLLPFKTQMQKQISVAFISSTFETTPTSRITLLIPVIRIPQPPSRAPPRV